MKCLVLRLLSTRPSGALNRPRALWRGCRMSLLRSWAVPRPGTRSLLMPTGPQRRPRRAGTRRRRFKGRRWRTRPTFAHTGACHWPARPPKERSGCS
ncbi:hypothetical protein BU26DRAFT_2564 [Trematosphaeria pertusa]|uniref:Uncharacterized protein n=1 Tax=Trematosphaeria pertusa TaxID=390896 RepID=A0A6A6IYQ5_9PLEO|nr:uncharacterized protein BU26DRAFT_2564 [Trematosphaeria pertusa]KAF2255554.1 hypothetical protein BU26DRAFT_2564 [Trematosphaeria pertusa]